MSKASVRFTLKNKAKLLQNFNQFGDNIKNVVHDLTEAKFIEMVNYAKTNAIWIDRTGNARQSIDSVDLSEKDVVKLYLTIGVDYGIWLEVANDGKYAILQNTLTIYEPEIMAMLEQVGVALTGGKLTAFRSYKS